MSLFLAESLTQANMTTAIETEILSISQEAIAAVLDYDQNLLNTISQEFSKYQREYLTETMQLPGKKCQEINQIEIAMTMASFAINR